MVHVQQGPGFPRQRALDGGGGARSAVRCTPQQFRVSCLLPQQQCSDKRHRQRKLWGLGGMRTHNTTCMQAPEAAAPEFHLAFPLLDGRQGNNRLLSLRSDDKNGNGGSGSSEGCKMGSAIVLLCPPASQLYVLQFLKQLEVEISVCCKFSNCSEIAIPVCCKFYCVLEMAARRGCNF